MIVKGGCRPGRHDETLSAPVRLVVMRLGDFRGKADHAGIGTAHEPSCVNSVRMACDHQPPVGGRAWHSFDNRKRARRSRKSEIGATQIEHNGVVE
jgi:hypothetical protein